MTSTSTSWTGPRRTCLPSASAPASTYGLRPIARYCLIYTNKIAAVYCMRMYYIMIMILMDWMTPPNPPNNIQVTKLCDLGPRDSVCAVHWSREGSYLSIGTGLGDVQVCLALLSPLPCRYCNSSQFKPSTKWKMFKLFTSGVPYLKIWTDISHVVHNCTIMHSTKNLITGYTLYRAKSCSFI